MSRHGPPQQPASSRFSLPSSCELPVLPRNRDSPRSRHLHPQNVSVWQVHKTSMSLREKWRECASCEGTTPPARQSHRAPRAGRWKCCAPPRAKTCAAPAWTAAPSRGDAALGCLSPAGASRTASRASDAQERERERPGQRTPLSSRRDERFVVQDQSRFGCKITVPPDVPLQPRPSVAMPRAARTSPRGFVFVV